MDTNELYKKFEEFCNFNKHNSRENKVHITYEYELYNNVYVTTEEVLSRKLLNQFLEYINAPERLRE